MSEIPFGKHVGKEIQEVAEEDPGYLRWLLKQDWFQEKFIHLVDEVEFALDEYGP